MMMYACRLDLVCLADVVLQLRSRKYQHLVRVVHRLWRRAPALSTCVDEPRPQTVGNLARCQS